MMTGNLIWIMMKRKFKFPLIYSFLIGSLIFTFWSCESTEVTQPPPNLEELRKKESLSESYNVKYYFSEQGQMKSLVAAPHVTEKIEPKTNEPILYFDRGIVVTFYDNLGKMESILTAKKAQLFRNSGYAVAEGNVIVKNQKDEKLETERLVWRRVDKKISTQSFVKVTTPKDIIIGDSLEANTSFTQYKIFKIHGILKVKE